MIMQYAKAIAAIVGGAVTSALTIWGPETNVGRFLVILSAALTAASVYAVRNAPAEVPPKV